MDTVRQSINPRVIWWQDICKHRAIYIAGLLSMLLTNGTEVLAPKALQWIIDSLMSASTLAGTPTDVQGLLDSDRFRSIVSAAMIFVTIAFFGLLGRVFWRFTLARMTHVSSNNMRQGIWESIRKSELESLGRFTLGDLMNRAIGDVNAARWIYGFTLVLTCDVIFFSLLGSIAMILIHPGLAIACLSTFVIIPFIAIKLARMEYGAHEAAQNELTTLSEQVSQSVRGIRAQRASYGFHVWTDAMKDSAIRYGALRLKAQKISINSFPLCNVPTILSYMILLAWGSQLVAEKSITIGQFAAMASYVYLLQGPLAADIGGLISEWQRGFASLRRISEIHQIQFQENPVSTKQNANSSDDRVAALKPSLLSVNNLSVVRGGRLIFNNVSFELQSGQWLGVSGRVGSGKSSLMQVIAGLIPSSGGVLRVDGKLMAAGSSSRLTSRDQPVAYAAEKPFVFSGTIRHNLCLNHAFSDDQLWKSLRAVNLAHEVTRMAKDLDSVVGEGGVSLSGGQRQRLALARLVLRPASLILLDDPLSAVDAETEAIVIRNLKETWADHAVIVTSNKTSTLDCCLMVGTLSKDGLKFEVGLTPARPMGEVVLHA